MNLISLSICVKTKACLWKANLLVSISIIGLFSVILINKISLKKILFWNWGPRRCFYLRHVVQNSSWPWIYQEALSHFFVIHKLSSKILVGLESVKALRGPIWVIHKLSSNSSWHRIFQAIHKFTNYFISCHPIVVGIEFFKPLTNLPPNSEIVIWF